MPSCGVDQNLGQPEASAGCNFWFDLSHPTRERVIDRTVHAREIRRAIFLGRVGLRDSNVFVLNAINIGRDGAVDGPSVDGFKVWNEGEGECFLKIAG